MNLTIITPTFYPNNTPIKYLIASADKHDIPLRNYGSFQPYTDWIQVQITECLKALDRVETSHVLFTDASDVIFLKPMAEIIKRYLRLGHPPLLVSMEEDGMNAGGWMAEIDVAFAAIEYLDSLRDIPFAGNPQERWRHALRTGEIRAERDTLSTIFSVNRFPTDACILHLAGGYSDPVTGRAERIEPIWKELGYEPVL